VINPVKNFMEDWLSNATADLLNGSLA